MHPCSPKAAWLPGSCPGCTSPRGTAAPSPNGKALTSSRGTSMRRLPRSPLCAYRETPRHVRETAVRRTLESLVWYRKAIMISLRSGRLYRWRKESKNLRLAFLRFRWPAALCTGRCRRDLLESHREFFREHDSCFVVADHVLTREVGIITIGITGTPDAMLARLNEAARIANQ